MLYETENPHGGDIYEGEIELDFSANTNPLGTPPGVISAMEKALLSVHRYPDPYCRKLTAAISRHEEAPREEILCGNGAAELIYSYCEAVRPRRALLLAPTFLEYELALLRAGAKVERYELKQENHFDLDENFLRFLAERKPEVLFLCNPNNPTGRLIPEELLLEILKCCKENQIRLFLDECFMDLTDRGGSRKAKLAQFPQLFLLKAFTKSYGMAGVRLGYGLSSDRSLLAKMARTVQPWNVSSLAQAAGCAALEEKEFLEETRRLVRTERRWLAEELEKLGFYVCPSSANYLLFFGGEGLHRALEKEKIAIRNCDNYRGLSAGWYRIAVRLHGENERLMEAVRRAAKK